MSPSLDLSSRNALVKYRVQRAFETLIEADYNAKGEYFNTAVNRLYYSAFYIVSALLISNGMECTTHKGVKTLLSLHFIKTGILPI